MATYENLRKGALKRGWRLSQRGATYRFTDAEGRLLHSGDFYSAAAFLASQPRLPLGPAPKPAPQAWEWAIDDYLHTIAAAGQRLTTCSTRQAHLRHMARGLGCAPDEVTAAALIEWFGRQTHWAPETRRAYRSAAKGFFSWAYREGRIPTYLGDVLPMVRQPKSVPRPAPDDAWEAALAAADPRSRLILRLAGEVGLRRSEVAQLHTRDVLIANGAAQLIVHGKGGKRRIVPISDEMAELLRRGGAGHTPGMPSQGWVFPDGFGGHLSARWIGTIVTQLLPEGYSMHTLRHRFATRAYRGTRNLRAVQTLLGHASIATTERYTAVDDDEIRAAAASTWESSPS
ncbi:tyrosine-type recombinase/integrase [Mycobacterium avium subsp. hominissuis]|uniref:tyrosine-type recombinase/integrase n=1 Tax=Mycobacterium avium TaxID=1764 RepID=UPI001CC51AF1|nr:tyrosine-type recombinase/integrase [Mycobacterium avium]MBZ4560280.1 tyrosine-type recombinase/integrase [Mycobacterium avium subsp. hominissuis]MBZ4569837.1 tyrosine-type recombinase/integrase [Mycobacterium avium subsp. hominissuis]MBZ4589570.1 tyrosine-type recombinase/integrase [Mycobacterium avium subsp. hominissuis]MBZ4625740.1 tyrosine-type recombinase/integrase [Mycobacterium avium subsp. hominissuis]